MPPLPHAWTPTRLASGSVTALAAGRSLALAALDDGTAVRLFRSARFGSDWAAADAGLPAGGLVAALHVRGARALMGTFGDGLFGSADAGRTWRPTGDGLPASASVLAFLAHGRALWAGTRAHGVFRSADGGASWRDVGAGLPWGGLELEILALAATPAGVVASHPLGLHRTSDGGRSWEPLSLGPHRGPAFGLVATPGGALVAGLGRVLARSPDGGQTWAEAVEATRGIPVGAAGRALYAATADGLARSDDGGATWHRFGDGLPAGVGTERVAGVGRTLLVGTLGHGLWEREAGRLQPAAGAQSPALEGSDPNPFHDGTTIAFHLPRPAEVVLAVDDGVGAEVARLDEGVRAAGLHRVPFQADGLPVGLYTARLDVEGQRWTRLMLRL